MVFPSHWEKKWPVFCLAIGHSQLKDDPRFNSFEKRFENSREMITMLDSIFATKTREEWLEIFKQNDLISCAINSNLELVDDPQIMENDYIVDHDDPFLGKIKIPGFPVRFEKNSVKTKSFSPPLGEHTTEVLKNLGSYDDKEIDQFKKQGII